MSAEKLKAKEYLEESTYKEYEMSGEWLMTESARLNQKYQSMDDNDPELDIVVRELSFMQTELSEREEEQLRGINIADKGREKKFYQIGNPDGWIVIDGEHTVSVGDK